jgi:hypothetical protein
LALEDGVDTPVAVGWQLSPPRLINAKYPVPSVKISREPSFGRDGGLSKMCGMGNGRRASGKHTSGRRTRVAPVVENVETLYVKHSDYHDMPRIIDDEEAGDNQNPVVVLSA